MCIASTCARAAAPARSPFLGSFDEEMLAGIQLSQGGFLTPGVGFFGKPLHYWGSSLYILGLHNYLYSFGGSLLWLQYNIPHNFYSNY